MSLAALEALIAGDKVRCQVVERDRHGRLVAKVFSPNRVDIGRRLVSAGWGLAYRRYSMDYLAAEHEARKARRGMWRGTFVKPWEWRASSPPRRTQAPVLATIGSRKPTTWSLKTRP
jgi:endonuclease YncB( thermonuclease family)